MKQQQEHVCTRARGFTLLEVAVVVVLLGSVLLTAMSIASHFLGQVEVAHAKQVNVNRANQVLERIQMAIRMTDEVKQAGDNLLVLKTRYYLDLDAGVETLRYTRDDRNQLRLEVASGAGPFGTPEVLLEDVTAFSGSYLRIADSFDTMSVNAVAVESDLTADTSVMAEYLVNDLAGSDPDLAASYNPELQRLEVAGTPTGVRTLTMSPRMKKKVLEVMTTFTPMTTGTAFHPILWGEPGTGSDSIAVVFRADGTIRLRSTSASGTQEAIGSVTWKSNNSYTVQLEVGKKKSKIKMGVNGARLTKIAEITTPSFDNKPVHFQVLDPAGIAAWDNVDIAYGMVEVQMTLRQPDGTVVVVQGGAVRRQ